MNPDVLRGMLDSVTRPTVVDVNLYNDPRHGFMVNVGEARRTVIVVGGGIAGSFTARWFDRFYHDRLDTILVDRKEYHEITFMTLRATVQDNNGFQKRMRVPHKNYVAHGQVVVEQCQEVALDHIKVGSSGKDLHVIPFDYLFISSGCHYSENIKTNSPSMAYRIHQYEAERRKIVESRRVLIIGAGVVGNELCGEIIDAFPKKEVIMVGRSTILSRAGPEAHRIIAEHWASKGVKKENYPQGVRSNDTAEVTDLSPSPSALLGTMMKNCKPMSTMKIASMRRLMTKAGSAKDDQDRSACSTNPISYGVARAM